jgi:hypothetical protein
MHITTLDKGSNFGSLWAGGAVEILKLAPV